MKLAVGMISVILVIFALFGMNEGVVITCNFDFMIWSSGIGTVYTCSLHSVENTGNLQIIEEVYGTHLSEKSNADVLGVYEYSQKLSYIPTNLASFFPNLKGLLFSSPLLRIIASDIKPFPNLLRFVSSNGEFTSIDGDLFQETRRIQVIEFHNGKLKNVGENLLDGLNSLIFVKFANTPCINFNANTPQTILELEPKLLLQCPPLILTTPAASEY
jgi:hypothetical protein